MMIIRILVVLLALLVAGFCVFGFMATFEPLEGKTPLILRAVYLLGFLCSLGGLLYQVRKWTRD